MLQPRVTAALLSTIAALKYRVITRDASGTKELGVLVERPAHKTLMIETAEGGARWVLGVAPPGTPAFLITRDTYDVLRAASAGEDGTLTYQGKRYRLQANDAAAPCMADLVAG